MLELLHIENIAIIDRADITFEPGFNALTGETGAGKSIVIDSLSAVLGQRTSRDLIRTGADKAYVSACFTGIPPEVGEDLGITWDEELLLQREIHADGKNVCRVGSRPVTVTQLRTLGSRLLNIHGQHDGQQLLDEEQHLLYLDSFGRTEPLLTAYREQYAKLTDIRRQMHALQMDEAEKARRMDTLRYQIQELQRAKLRPGEEEELTSRRNLLRNGEKFMSAVSEADFCLSGDDSTSGALALLRQAGADGHLNFIGNIEAKEAIKGGCDVIVTDGFSGNILLKTMEGVGSFAGHALGNIFKKNLLTKLAAAMVMPGLRAFKAQLDPNKVGGTAFIGISKPVIKAHGASNAEAIDNAIGQARQVAESGIIGQIQENVHLMQLQAE